MNFALDRLKNIAGISETRGGVVEAWVQYLTSVWEGVEIPLAANHYPLYSAKGKLVVSTPPALTQGTEPAIMIEFEFEGRIDNPPWMHIFIQDIAKPALLKHPLFKAYRSLEKKHHIPKDDRLSIHILDKKDLTDCWVRVYLPLQWIIDINEYPPNVNESVDVSLQEARGGAVEAWVSALKRVCEAISIPVKYVDIENGDMGYEGVVRFNLQGSTLDDYPQDNYIAYVRKDGSEYDRSVIFRADFIFDGEIDAKDVLWQRLRMLTALGEASNKIAKVVNNHPLAKKLVRINSANKLFSLSNTIGVSVHNVNNEPPSVKVLFYLTVVHDQNIYPYTLQESSALWEARGGAVEAWRQEIGNKLQDFKVNVYYWDDEFRSKKGAKYILDRVDISENESGLPTFKVLIGFSGELLSTDPENANVITPLTTKRSLRILEDNFVHIRRRFGLQKISATVADSLCKTSWKYYWSEGKDGEMQFIAEIVMPSEKLPYPGDITESFLGYTFESSLLAEARGGVTEAWVQFLTAELHDWIFPLRIKSLKNKKESSFMGLFTVGRVYVGNLQEMVVELRMDGEKRDEKGKVSPFTFSISDGKLTDKIWKSGFVQSFEKESVIEEMKLLGVNFFWSMTRDSNNQPVFFARASADALIGANIYPKAVQEGIFPLVEARGGALGVWEQKLTPLLSELDIAISKTVYNSLQFSIEGDIHSNTTYSSLLAGKSTIAGNHVITFVMGADLRVTSPKDGRTIPVSPQMKTFIIRRVIDPAFQAWANKFTILQELLSVLGLHEFTVEGLHVSKDNWIIVASVNANRIINNNIYPSSVSESVSLLEFKGGFIYSLADKIRQELSSFRTKKVAVADGPFIIDGIEPDWESTGFFQFQEESVTTNSKNKPSIKMLFRWKGKIKLTPEGKIHYGEEGAIREISESHFDPTEIYDKNRFMSEIVRFIRSKSPRTSVMSWVGTNMEFSDPIFEYYVEEISGKQYAVVELDTEVLQREGFTW
jgi:hypothetical protein